MGEYKYSIIVGILLIFATIMVSFYYFSNNKVVKNTGESFDDNNYAYNNESFNNSEINENLEEYSKNDINFNNIGNEIISDNDINSHIENSINTNDIQENTNNKEEKSIFDQDFSRENKKTEPEITYTNALKLGRWEENDYINDELGIKIFLLPGWSLHDFSNSFHLNEGSGQVNLVTIDLFDGNFDNYVRIVKSSNKRIFGTVTESKEKVGGVKYTVLKCKYNNKDYFERTVYFTDTKMENIHICIETDLYNTNAPFTTRNYKLSDFFEKF